MKLRGIDFGPIAGASGVQGFFGNPKIIEYKHHDLYERIFGKRFSFDGMTFVGKTTTAGKTVGNMPLQADGFRPKELLPKCIHCSPSDFFAGRILNAVGLSNPGFEALLNMNEWQRRENPFYLSFMPIGDSSTWAEQCTALVRILRSRIDEFQTWFALQVNVSCPNVKAAHGSDFVNVARACLDILAELDIAIEIKLNVLEHMMTSKAISDHPACDALCVSNTIPFDSLNDFIDWTGMYGTQSPIARKIKNPQAKGGLSGKLLFPFVVRWVESARKSGIKKPIRAGGGVFSPNDVQILHDVGASGVFIGSVAILRPWRVQSIIQTAHRIFNNS